MRRDDRLVTERLLERSTFEPSALDTDCLVWNGSRNRKGYGHIRWRGRVWQTHRAAWAEVHGEIADELQVLHRCDNPPCWADDHLFLGTNAENQADKGAKGRHPNTRKTHCPQGHPYNDANTYWHDGRRKCRTCLQVKPATGTGKVTAR